MPCVQLWSTADWWLITFFCTLLGAGEIDHSGPGENRQFQPI